MHFHALRICGLQHIAVGSFNGHSGERHRGLKHRTLSRGRADRR